MIYIFLGPPASGKGTQARMLSEAINVPYISLGAAFRQLGESKPEVKAIVDKGNIVPLSMYRELMEHLAKDYPEDGILDGAFRLVEQVDVVAKLWSPQNCLVIWIEIPDEEIRKRTYDRQRVDDAAAVVNHRIAIYRQAIPSIISQLQGHGFPIVQINGLPTPEEIHHTILATIQTHEHTS